MIPCKDYDKNVEACQTCGMQDDCPDGCPMNGPDALQYFRIRVLRKNEIEAPK